VILDQYTSRRDEAARRRVSFQGDHASGPGQAISATAGPNRNLSELRGKNPPVHRREYFQASPPSGLAALTPRAETITQLIAEFDDQDVARAIDRLEKGHGSRVAK
jgi:hypothetical protein